MTYDNYTREPTIDKHSTATITFFGGNFSWRCYPNPWKATDKELTDIIEYIQDQTKKGVIRTLEDLFDFLCYDCNVSSRICEDVLRYLRESGKVYATEREDYVGINSKNILRDTDKCQEIYNSIWEREHTHSPVGWKRAEFALGEQYEEDTDIIEDIIDEPDEITYSDSFIRFLKLVPEVYKIAKEHSTTNNINMSVVVHPAIGLVAGLLSTQHRLRRTYSWVQAGNLWNVTFGEASTGKTPGFELAFKPYGVLKELIANTDPESPNLVGFLSKRFPIASITNYRPGEAEFLKDHCRPISSYRYKEYLSTRTVEVKEPKESGRGTELVPKHIPIKFGVGAGSKEGFVKALNLNNRGVFLAEDELGFLFKMFNSGGVNGGAIELMCKGWNGSVTDQNYKQEESVTIIDNFISLVGNIQPRSFAKSSIKEDLYDTGFVFRPLYAFVKRRKDANQGQAPDFDPNSIDYNYTDSYMGSDVAEESEEYKKKFACSKEAVNNYMDFVYEIFWAFHYDGMRVIEELVKALEASTTANSSAVGEQAAPIDTEEDYYTDMFGGETHRKGYRVYRLGKKARVLLDKYTKYNQYRFTAEHNPDIGDYIGKLDGQALRLALVLHIMRCMSDIRKQRNVTCHSYKFADELEHWLKEPNGGSSYAQIIKDRFSKLRVVGEDAVRAAIAYLEFSLQSFRKVYLTTFGSSSRDMSDSHFLMVRIQQSKKGFVTWTDVRDRFGRDKKKFKKVLEELIVEHRVRIEGNLYDKGKNALKVYLGA